IVIAGVGVYALTNHGNNDGSTDESAEIVVNGSTTVAPIMTIVKEKYEALYSSVTIQLNATGSSTGAAAAINGTADLAMLSRDLKESEISDGLHSYTIGKDGIAMIVNSGVTGVSNLTMQQIADIYAGKITNWNEVGGADAHINLIGRESNSGTRGAFEELLTKADSTFTVTSSMIEMNSNNALLTAVGNTANAIGYVSLGIALTAGSSAVTILDVGGVHATVANVVAGTYTLQRSLNLATKGEANGAVLDLINWILGTEGQKIVEDEGYIPISS
ncbi:MAG: phosphate ABC transporter substrate-binding protein, partial [Candidatus Methanomethylophilus sp.]|nr:phosphate ABC transporter substrate-binding protein [Methanomethylophilus sp.]